MEKLRYPTLRLVFDRKHLATKTKTAPVSIELLYRRQRKYVPTEVHVYLGQWSEKEHVIARGDREELNEKIETLTKRIRQYLNELEKNKIEFSFDLVEKFLQISKKSDSFIKFIEETMKEESLSKGSKKVLGSEFKKFTEFGLIKTFDDLTDDNIKLWDKHLRDGGMEQSTIAQYHGFVKKYVRAAIRAKQTKIDPYNAVPLKRGKSETIKYLTEDELEAIMTVELPKEHLRRGRDVFVFCCFTGIAPIDMLNEKDFTHLRPNKNGVYGFRGNRQKTGVEYITQFAPPALEVLKRYDFVLPITSLSWYSETVKKVARFAGITRRFYPYMARHTFATTVALGNGVKIENLSRMMGHSNMAITQHYAKILAKNVNMDWGNVHQFGEVKEKEKAKKEKKSKTKE